MLYIKDVGDSAIAIVLGNEIDEKINIKVRAIAKAIEENVRGVEVVSTYATIYVYYNPEKFTYSRILYEIKPYLDVKSISDKGRIVEIPVLYGGDFGPDIGFVASYNSLSVENVIKIHTSSLYRVYMLGFLPGFAYLGGLDPRIATPRLKTPRINVAAGSVGIAENQTGWYAIESPGGWQIIGRTPLKMFNINSSEPTAVLPGDLVKFRAIDEKEFQRIYQEEWKDAPY